VHVIVPFARSRMLPFARVLAVIEKRRHAAWKRRAAPQNSKRQRWNANVRQMKLGHVFPMRETVGDGSPDTSSLRSTHRQTWIQSA